MDANSRRLYELGVADRTSRFDAVLGLVRDPFVSERHSPHHSLWHAAALLDGGEISLAGLIIEAVLQMQERRVDDPHYGNFRWHFEDEAVIDLNACQFVLEALVRTPLEKLPADVRERLWNAMGLAFVEAERLDVHWTYTNIFLLDVHNRILGGELLREEAIVRGGVERLRDWAHRTQEAVRRTSSTVRLIRPCS